MIKFVHLLLAFTAALSVMGQSGKTYLVNDKNFYDLQVPFIEVQICNKFLSRKVIMFIDYGQENRGRKTCILKVSDGSDAEFNSNVDALNFLTYSGFELIHTQYFQDSSGSRSGNLILLMKNLSFQPAALPD